MNPNPSPAVKPITDFIVPKVPCNEDAGKLEAWKTFFLQLNQVLNDVNFYRVLLYCASSHQNCVQSVTPYTQSPSPSPSLSPFQNTLRPLQALMKEGTTAVPVQIVTPCGTFVRNSFINPIISQDCINCIFAGDCSPYKASVLIISHILQNFQCPLPPDIDANYVKSVMESILNDPVLCSSYDIDSFAKLIIDDDTVTSVVNVINTWKNRFDFTFCQPNPQPASFWEQYGWITVIFAIALIVIIYSIFFVEKKTQRVRPLYHMSRSRPGEGMRL